MYAWRHHEGVGRLYGLPEPRQTGYLCTAAILVRPPLAIPQASASLQAMDSFEVNKILGAILGTCLGVLSINIAAGAIFTPVKPAKPGYDIVVPETQPGGAAKPAEPEVPIEQ